MNVVLQSVGIHHLLIRTNCFAKPVAADTHQRRWQEGLAAPSLHRRYHFGPDLLLRTLYSNDPLMQLVSYRNR